MLRSFSEFENSGTSAMPQRMEMTLAMNRKYVQDVHHYGTNKIRKNESRAKEFFLDIRLSPLYYSKVLFVSGSARFF